MIFQLNQRVRHIASGLTYVVIGLTVDCQALIDLGGEGVIRGWVPLADIEAL